MYSIMDQGSIGGPCSEEGPLPFPPLCGCGNLSMLHQRLCAVPCSLILRKGLLVP